MAKSEFQANRNLLVSKYVIVLDGTINRILTIKQKDKKTYYEEKIDNLKDISKQMWREIKQFFDRIKENFKQKKLYLMD